MRNNPEIGSPTPRRHFLKLAAGKAARLAALSLVTFPWVSTPAKAGRDERDDRDDCRGALCFLEGTCIRTPDGEIAVENLKIGDLVETLRGALPVKWIGYQIFKKTASKWTPSVVPIRVARFALHDQYPERDLYLSGDHSVFIDGILIPVKYLVNGKSVSEAVVDSDEISYFAIELDSHEVIYAEGTPAETLLVTAGRENFRNFVEYKRLYGDGEQLTMNRFAPLLGYEGARPEIKALLRLALTSIGGACDPVWRAYERVWARAEMANLKI